MVVLRCVGLFKTIKGLFLKIQNTISKGCHKVDVMADNNRTVSWKNKARNVRGEATRTIIKSVETEILDSHEFLNDSYNKTQHVDQN